jgi:hypothetical protein
MIQQDIIGELTFGGSFEALNNDGHPAMDWMKKFILLKYIVSLVYTTTYGSNIAEMCI